jgi:hypothetical protein
VQATGAEFSSVLPPSAREQQHPVQPVMAGTFEGVERSRNGFINKTHFYLKLKTRFTEIYFYKNS